MSSVSYNGDVVNGVIDNIKTISQKVPSISSAIKSATNQIISAKGFSRYVNSGVSSNSFSSVVDECGTMINNFTNQIRQKQVSVLSYSNDTGEINAFLDTLSRDEFDRLDLTEIDSYIGLDRRAGNVLKGLWGDVLTAGAGLVEGIADFGETVLDTGALLVTGAGSIFSGLYDLVTGDNAT